MSDFYSVSITAPEIHLINQISHSGNKNKNLRSSNNKNIHRNDSDDETNNDNKQK
jgi:hypothetical protein